MTAVLLGGGLAIWFACSVINQLPGRRLGPLKRWDLVAMIPAWSFFAPNPGTTDHWLLYRDRFFDGTLGQWRTVDTGDTEGALRCLWNPGKRKNKAFVDAASELSSLLGDYEPQNLQLSLAYLLMLTVVSREERSPFSEARQFAIAETYGYHTSLDPVVRFRSEFHTL